MSSLEYKFEPSPNIYQIIDKAIEALATKCEFSELVNSEENPRLNGSLWLDKYKPKNYLELLSDETTNRCLLRWIKAWDYYVFKRKPKAPIPIDPNQKTYGVNENLIEEIDETDKRPKFKLILIHGPPGLGKTTLAHLLATKAGYNVVEMNASDDRSPDTLRTKLEAIVGTSMSLNSTNNEYRPSCLIIDEIDGATVQAIELLIEASKLPVTGKKSKNSKLAIRRPVICICNDLYTKSMKAFRSTGASCFILKCPLPSVGRLTQRLCEIVENEFPSIQQRSKNTIDKGVLHSLIDICERDIRACVNALQYICVQLGGDVRNVDLDSILKATGMYKDHHATLFTVWHKVFTLPSPNMLADSNNLSKRIKEIVDIFYSTGEPNLFISGVFENYLDINVKDAGMVVMSEASQLIEFYDKLMLIIAKSQDYSFMRYTSIVPAWFNLSLATFNGVVRKKSFFDKLNSDQKNQHLKGIKWPTSDLEAMNNTTRICSTIDSFMSSQWSGPVGVTRSDSIRLLSKRDFVLDTAPCLVDIISAKTSKLRPVNSQLYSRQEKTNLSEIIDIMLSFGLSWKLQANNDSEENELEYHLNPPINTCVEFKDDEGHAESSTIPLKKINGAVKKLISHEMHFEEMRRSEKPADTINPSTTLDKSRFELIIVKNDQLDNEEAARVVKPKRDFFGRIIEKKVVQPQVDKKDGNKENLTPLQKWDLINKSLWFKHREGFSNAVRLPVSRKRLEL